MSEPVDGDDRSPGTSPQDPAALPPGARPVSLRRAPRYRAFVLTGVAVGVVVAAVLTVAFPEHEQFSAPTLFGYVAVVLSLVLGLAGALVAVLVDRPQRR